MMRHANVNSGLSRRSIKTSLLRDNKCTVQPQNNTSSKKTSKNESILELVMDDDALKKIGCEFSEFRTFALRQSDRRRDIDALKLIDDV